MELTSKTGVTETGVIRATKSIGALMFTISNMSDIEGLETETIKVWVERANGDNFDICDEILLKDFIAMSTWMPDDGIPHNDSDDNLVAICELSKMGAIPLLPNESIKFEMKGLVALNTYIVNGIEYPTDAESIIEYDQQRLLSDEKLRKLNVQKWDTVLFGADVFRDITLVYNNGERVTYTNKELRALSRDVKPNHTWETVNDVNTSYPNNQIIFPLIDVQIMEVNKITGTLDLLFRRDY